MHSYLSPSLNGQKGDVKLLQHILCGITYLVAVVSNYSDYYSARGCAMLIIACSSAIFLANLLISRFLYPLRMISFRKLDQSYSDLIGWKSGRHGILKRLIILFFLDWFQKTKWRFLNIRSHLVWTSPRYR